MNKSYVILRLEAVYYYTAREYLQYRQVYGAYKKVLCIFTERKEFDSLDVDIRSSIYPVVIKNWWIDDIKRLDHETGISIQSGYSCQ